MDVLSAELKDATVEQNTAGQPSKIVDWEIPEDIKRRIREGRPVVLKVEDTNGNDLPRDTKLAIGYREPGTPLDSYKSLVGEFGIAPFNDLSIADQRSQDNAEPRVLRFNEEAPQGFLETEEGDHIELWIQSSVSIDPDTLIFEYPMSEKNI